MKTIHIYSLSIIFLASCSMPNKYHQKINDIPTKAPNFTTELRLTNDNLPKIPYFEIIAFNIVEKGSKSKQEIKKRLELEAMKEGVDAIIDIDYWTETNKEMNFFTVMMDMVGADCETTYMPVKYTHITGRGIMYLDNLDFIDGQVEYEYFYKMGIESDLPVPLFKIEYKLTGQVFKVYPEIDNALDIYKKYFQFYSDFHLLKQRERWTYIMNGPLLKKRILRNLNGAIAKKCLLKYNGNSRLIKIKIIHYSSRIDRNEIVNYLYDDRGTMIKRIVEVYDGTNIIEEYIYENNRLTGKQISINRTAKEPILLKTFIKYYDPNYLKDYYFNEYVNTLQN